MTQQITIRIEDNIYQARLRTTPTACAILNALPLNARVHTWGGEIYFPVTINCNLEEDSREILQPGELAYWPSGPAFCIFFGPTVISQGDEIRAASAVNIFGNLIGDLSSLWDIQEGGRISISKV